MTPTTERDAWPIAEFDPVRRLHVLAATIPGLCLVERTIPASFEDVWNLASDLEYELPRLGTGFVTDLRITHRDGDELVARVHGPLGIRDDFAITLRPGWCWMEGHALSAAMAATATPDGTLFAWAARMKIPGGGLLRPLSSRSLRRTLATLEEHVIERQVSPRACHGLTEAGGSSL